MFNFLKKKAPTTFQQQLKKIHDADHSIPNTVPDDRRTICEETVQKIVTAIRSQLMQNAAIPGKRKLDFSSDIALHLWREEDNIRYNKIYDSDTHHFYSNCYHDAEVVLTLLFQELINMGATNLHYVIGRRDVNSKDKPVRAVAEVMGELHEREQYPNGRTGALLHVKGTIRY